MPLVLEENAPEPEGIDVGPEEARDYLAEFIRWLWRFLRVIANSPDADDLNGERFFEDHLREFILAALNENEGNFGILINAISDADPDLIRRHGLYGVQLKLKLVNVNRPLSLFRRMQSAGVLKRIFQSVNSLLSSILSAVPGPGAVAGSALSELKEAVENSVKIRA